MEIKRAITYISSFTGYLLVFSCTIIQDGDITSEAQLSKLRLKGFEILQQTTKVNTSTLGILLYDSTVKFTDQSTGAKITRKMRFSLAPFGNSLKMRLRSGTTAKTELYVSFKDDGQPYTFIIYQGDSLVEWYRFRYSSYTGPSSKLNKITTVLNPVDGLPEKVRTNDTLIYTSSNVTSIIRRSPYGSTSTTIITYSGSGSGLQVEKSTGYELTRGNCPNGATFDSCTGYLISGSSSYTIAITQTSDLIEQILLQDQRSNNSGGSGNPTREYDTYYFHPLMLLRNQVGQGNYLMVIYMMDWWVPGANTTGGGNLSNDESVTVKFNYGL